MWDIVTAMNDDTSVVSFTKILWGKTSEDVCVWVFLKEKKNILHNRSRILLKKLDKKKLTCYW